MRVLDQWVKQGDRWNEAKAHRQAVGFGKRLARDLREMDAIRGRYVKADFEEFAKDLIIDFHEHQKFLVEEAAKRIQALPVEREPMRPDQIVHAGKYETLAQEVGVDRLKELIPASREQIRRALETGDQHLNSIPLRKWDMAAELIGGRLSLSEKVSLLKHVAKWHYV
jgi:hypothetical protein